MSIKEEIHAFIVQRHFFALIDLVRIHNNIAQACLTEDPGQTHHRDPLRIDHITEHISSSYTWKLVNVTN